MNTPTPTALTPFQFAKSALTDDDFKKQIALALPKHLTPDRMLRIALTAALSQPKIGEACRTKEGKASLFKALLTASQLGLEVDGRQGHLVPFNDKRLGMTVVFIPGFQGLIGLAYNHPKVRAIYAEPVYANDRFVYKIGLNRVLEHEPADMDDRGALTHAYAVAELEGGAKTFICLTRREVMKAKASSRGADSDFSPWRTHESAMWVKTAIRQLSKFIPQSSELRSALEVEDVASEIDAPIGFQKPEIDVESTPVPSPEPEPPKKLGRPPKVESKPVEAPVVPVPPPDITPQERLGSFLEEGKVTFTDFQSWLQTTTLKDSDSYGSIAELPTEFCEKLLKDTASLSHIVTKFGAKEK